MTPLTLVDHIVRLLDEARTLPACRESAQVIIKLQEACLWLIELQVVEEGTSHTQEDTL